MRETGCQQPNARIQFGALAKCRNVKGKTVQASEAYSDPSLAEGHEIPVAIADFRLPISESRLYQ